MSFISLQLAFGLHRFFFKIENSLRHPVVFLPGPVECEAGEEKEEEHEAQTTDLCSRDSQLGGSHCDALNIYKQTTSVFEIDVLIDTCGN